LDEAAKNEEQIAHERLMLVQDQLNGPQTQRFGKILCPYCGHWNFKRTRTLCCDTLRKAIIAILSGERALRIAEAQQRAELN